MFMQLLWDNSRKTVSKDNSTDNKRHLSIEDFEIEYNISRTKQQILR